MTDLHCHILPALDDGSPDLDTSVEMAAMAAANNTSIIVATPHCNVVDSDLENRCKVIIRKAEQLQQILDNEGIDLRILPGMEVFARDNLKEVLDSGNFLTLGGSKYLLVEFDFDDDTEFMEYSFSLIRQKGLVPVMAHPERYTEIQDDPERIVPFFESGTIIQVNRGSALGSFGKAPREAVKWILERGLAHVMASDAHGLEHRTPDLSEGYDYVTSHYSGFYADILMSRNPGRIVANRDIVSP